MCFIQKSRIRRLKSFKKTFLLLEGQIHYAYTSIPEALMNIAYKSSYTYISDFYGYVGKELTDRKCNDFHEAWDNGIRLFVQGIYLTQDDCSIIRNVGNMPLYLDCDMQIKVLEETTAELEQTITEAETEIGQKCKIYKCTGFAVGVFIVLILI
jgi:stage III sporulation protein AB